MKFSDLKLYHYRNFNKEAVSFSSGLNIFLGKNGAGKTNFLESLYFTSRGNSFRPTNSHSLQNQAFLEEPSVYILANIEKNGLKYDVKTTFAGAKKQHYLNGKIASSSTLVREFPILLFSPELLSVIKDGPQYRRELVDDSLLLHQPKNIRLLRDFGRIIRSRNQFLKAHLKGEQDNKSTLLLLDSIDPDFIEVSFQLTKARITLLNNLKSTLLEATSFIFHENVDISVDYLISEQSFINESTEKLQTFLIKRAKELRPAELSSGITLFGPHKHDIKFYFNGHDSRYYSSQGQQRAIILSFRLAQAAYHNRIYGYYPVLMLDDVLSELDDDKRKQLIEFLRNVRSQVFVTTTDILLPAAFSRIDGIIFEIEDGRISKTRS